jgi:hypothetical protein
MRLIVYECMSGWRFVSFGVCWSRRICWICILAVRWYVG